MSYFASFVALLREVRAAPGSSALFRHHLPVLGQVRFPTGEGPPFILVFLCLLSACVFSLHQFFGRLFSVIPPRVHVSVSPRACLACIGSPQELHGLAVVSHRRS